MENKGNLNFREGQRRMANVLSAVHEWIYQAPASIDLEKQGECERCGYLECACGTPEFETWISQALDAAAEREVL